MHLTFVHFVEYGILAQTDLPEWVGSGHYLWPRVDMITPVSSYAAEILVRSSGVGCRNF
jgi:hypothetical protein